jgi:hypothetical protein
VSFELTQNGVVLANIADHVQGTSTLGPVLELNAVVSTALVSILDGLDDLDDLQTQVNIAAQRAAMEQHAASPGKEIKRSTEGGLGRVKASYWTGSRQSAYQR